MTRIISGQARGRTIAVPPEGTRPTSDRAREGLFSSLDARFGFQDITVLDLFAGSGALGLEAASRGAREVHLVDNSPAACRVMSQNAQVIDGVNIRVHQLSAEAYLSQASEKHFDMVLADPPYAVEDEVIRGIVDKLRKNLKDGAIVVVERHVDSPETDWPEGFEPTTQKLKKRIYGIARMDMAFYHRNEEKA